MHEMVDFFLHLKYINNDNFYLSDKMKFKGPTMMFSLIALSVILVSGFVFQEGVFAQLEKQGMSVTITANEGSSKIILSGETSKVTPIAIIVTEPMFGNIIHTDQVSPDANGNFEADINVGGSQWKQNGFYTISASQGGSFFTDSVEVDIVDGAIIPEFGAIAALILAVAIISIIVVSTKTRLSIIPRY